MSFPGAGWWWESHLYEDLIHGQEENSGRPLSPLFNLHCFLLASLGTQACSLLHIKTKRMNFSRVSYENMVVQGSPGLVRGLEGILQLVPSQLYYRFMIGVGGGWSGTISNHFNCGPWFNFIKIYGGISSFLNENEHVNIKEKWQISSSAIQKAMVPEDHLWWIVFLLQIQGHLWVCHISRNVTYPIAF